MQFFNDGEVFYKLSNSDTIYQTSRLGGFFISKKNRDQKITAMTLFKEVLSAKKQLQNVVPATPLAENLNLSDEFKSTILLKREDLQIVRS